MKKVKAELKGMEMSEKGNSAEGIATIMENDHSFTISRQYAPYNQRQDENQDDYLYPVRFKTLDDETLQALGIELDTSEIELKFKSILEAKEAEEEKKRIAETLEAFDKGWFHGMAKEVQQMLGADYKVKLMTTRKELEDALKNDKSWYRDNAVKVTTSVKLSNGNKLDFEFDIRRETTYNSNSYRARATGWYFKLTQSYNKIGGNAKKITTVVKNLEEHVRIKVASAERKIEAVKEQKEKEDGDKAAIEKITGREVRVEKEEKSRYDYRNRYQGTYTVTHYHIDGRNGSVEVHYDDDKGTITLSHLRIKDEKKNDVALDIIDAID